MFKQIAIGDLFRLALLPIFFKKLSFNNNMTYALILRVPTKSGLEE